MTPRWFRRKVFLAGIGLADLRFRKGPTTICLIAGAMTVFAGVLFSFYPYNIHSSSAKVYEESLPRRVIAIAGSNRASADEAEMSAIEEWEQVENVQPAVEFGAVVSAGDGSPMNRPLTGVTVGDAALPDSRLLWGRSFQHDDQETVIVSRELFTRLGGALSLQNEPIPPYLTVQVARIFNNERQEFSVDLSIVGILKHDRRNQFFIPMELAVGINSWLSHHVDSLPGSDHPSFGPVRYPQAFAYVPATHRHRIAAEMEQFEISLEPIDEFPIVEVPRNGAWLDIVSDDDMKPDAIERELQSWKSQGIDIEIHKCRQFEWTPRRGGPVFQVAVLSADDLRWQRDPPPFGQLRRGPGVLPRDVTTDWGTVVVSGNGQRIAGCPKADFYTTPETAAYLTFNPFGERTVVRRTLVHTDDIELAARLESKWRTTVRSDRSQFWAIYEAAGRSPSTGPVENGASGNNRSQSVPRTRADSIENAVRNLRSESPRVTVGTVYDTEATIRANAISRTQRGSARSGLTVRWIPDDLFLEIAGASRIPRSLGAWSCLWVGRSSQPPSNRMRLLDRRLDILRHVPSTGDDEVWFPHLFLKDHIARGMNPEPAGLSAQGIWQRSPRFEKQLEQHGTQTLSWKRTHSARPRNFWMNLDRRADELSRELADDADACRIEEAWMIPISLFYLNQRRARWCALHDVSKTSDGRSGLDNSRAENGRNRVLNRARSNSQETDSSRSDRIELYDPTRRSGLRGDVTIGNGDRRTVQLKFSTRLDPDVALLSPELFRKVAFETKQRRTPVIGDPRFTLKVNDGLSLARINKRSTKLQTAPHTPVPLKQIVKCALEDETGTGGIDQRKLRSLWRAKPTITTAVGVLELPMKLGRNTATLSSTQADDPRQFQQEMIFGRWPTGEGPEVCLSTGLIQEVFPSRNAEELIGSALRATFERRRKLHAVEPGLERNLTIVGIIDTKEQIALAPLSVLEQLTHWSEGRLIFDEGTGEFRTRSEVAESLGYVRIAVDARHVDDVPQLVTLLTERGYEVRHQLEQQEGLKKLAQALTVFVVLCVAGIVTLSMLAIGATTYMHVQSRKHEVGIMKCFGATPTEIMLIYATQGLVLGLLSFVLGGALAIGVEPYIRGPLSHGFSVEMNELLTVDAHSPELWWIYLITLLVVISLSVIGTTFPAGWASRLRPAVLMDQRE